MRSVVAGSRAVGLAEELANARRILEDAGVAASVTAPDQPLPLTVDATLGWIVREGATNVLRHSAARHCTIAVAVTAAQARLEISDDGRRLARGTAAGRADATAGTGLDGLRERVEAAGGEFSAESSDSGFRLIAVVPIPEKAR